MTEPRNAGFPGQPTPPVAGATVPAGGPQQPPPPAAPQPDGGHFGGPPQVGPPSAPHPVEGSGAAAGVSPVSPQVGTSTTTLPDPLSSSGAASAYSPPGSAAGQSPWWATDAAHDPWRDPNTPAVVVTHPAGPPAPQPPFTPPPGAQPVVRRGLGLVFLVSLVTALLAGALGGAIGYVAAAQNGGALRSEAPPLAKRPPGTVAEVVNQVLPSVVTILIEARGKRGNGSGFVVSSDGHIVTNEHVVAAGAGGSLRVVFSDGTSVPARIVGTDRASDLAVLKVDRTGLKAVQIGDSEQLAVGDPVIAIGAPLGLSNTVTLGIVSALDRAVATGEEGDPSVTAAIQTDAAINPGNSGGPLLDGAGRVVGVNSAIKTIKSSEDSTAGNIGLGFAIPSNQMKWVSKEIIAHGKSRRPVIGASIDQRYEAGGARLLSVVSNGPAARAGLREGDVIVKFNGRVVNQPIDLVALVRKYPPGTSVPIEYTRGGERKNTHVTLAADTN